MADGIEAFTDVLRFLKTDKKARYQGYTFYFREGLCWSDINTVFLKCRKKQHSIHDVKSMSVFVNTEVISENYVIALINTQLFSYYVDTFVNNTQTFQINDARQLPIIIPDPLMLDEINKSVQAIIENKINGKEFCEIEEYVEHVVSYLYHV